MTRSTLTAIVDVVIEEHPDAETSPTNAYLADAIRDMVFSVAREETELDIVAMEVSGAPKAAQPEQPQTMSVTAGGNMTQTIHQVAPEPRPIDYRTAALAYAIQSLPQDCTPETYTARAAAFETYLQHGQPADTTPPSCGEWDLGSHKVCRRPVEDGRCAAHGPVGPQ